MTGCVYLIKEPTYVSLYFILISYISYVALTNSILLTGISEPETFFRYLQTRRQRRLHVSNGPFLNSYALRGNINHDLILRK